MLSKIKRSIMVGPIEHTAPELARIMTESHKTYMEAGTKLRAMLTRQNEEQDAAHKYIAALKPQASA